VGKETVGHRLKQSLNFCRLLASNVKSTSHQGLPVITRRVKGCHLTKTTIRERGEQGSAWQSTQPV